ncbi:hypothetical protein F4553_004993 [Allocatelliglobosispora scoriae]|uniref:Uncharacterized protein n=1 Tax=Allocatelliglobosispora scoriae TaxID=643052 RepID=A0A841BTT5_9ACTN|nr:hypothetical protein [Allocatelliglobosispora scoriae]MBB5871614.1 hypothetical protein [Allocatelliglobosispora scoriae]
MTDVTTSTLPRTVADWKTLALAGPNDDQRPTMLKVVYRFWLVALALKLIGSTWDMSWHFKWLRDDLAPPHDVNTVGTVIAVALVIYQVRTGLGLDKISKWLLIWGTGTFLIALPIDVLNHKINGLDITAWSGSHSLLYTGTALMILGVARSWHITTPPGRGRTIVSIVLWGFFLENVLFPNQHQEYGVLSFAAWLRGEPYAEPILLKFAADQLGRPVDDIAVHGFALPVADWVYPAWIVGAALLSLVAARKFVGFRWTATAIAVGYVAYRCLAWELLTLAHFPPSAVPFALIAGAVVIDLAFLLSADGISGIAAAVGGAAGASAAFAGALWLQGRYLEAPPSTWAAIPIAGVVLAIGWVLVEKYAGQRRSNEA